MWSRGKQTSIKSQISRIKIASSSILLALLGASYCHHIPSERSASLDEKVRSLIKTHGLAKADIGIYIHSATMKRPLYKMNADEKLVPASNVKLFTASAAHAILDEKICTQLSISGNIEDKTLKGDLVVEAGGDPNISGRFHDDDTIFLFKEWAKVLKTKGIARIEGNIKLYDYIFDREYIYEDWQRYDLTQWYTAPVSAFALNDNCIDIKVLPTSPGNKCRISTNPITRSINILNNTSTVKGNPKKGITVLRKNGTITVSGEVDDNSRGESFSTPVEEPQLFFGNVLKETLEGEGISVTGKVELVGQEPKSGLEVISVSESKLSTSLGVCLVRSQNFYAEMLLKLMGHKKFGKGTRMNGIKAINDFLRGKGLEGVDLADGSGLSRANKTSSKQIAELLIAVQDNNTIRNSLPRSGEDGSLKKRMKAIKGKVAGKTGHLKGVTSLSGYLENKYGDTIIFSILVNGGNGDPFQDDLLEYLYTLKID